MKKKFLLGAMLSLASLGALTGCSEASEAKLANIYIAKYTISKTNTYKDQNGQEVTETTTEQYYEQLQLFDNGNYALTCVNA